MFRTWDADELKAIKRGGWTLDQVQAESAALFTLAEASKNATALPMLPNREAVESWLVDTTIASFRTARGA